MGRDLTSMIEEINNASSSLSKTTKTDGPVSIVGLINWGLYMLMVASFKLFQVVKVLNGHLSQLQWIDQNASALQAKVAAAQKAGYNIGSNGFGGSGDDAADDFYRSYMGRR